MIARSPKRAQVTGGIRVSNTSGAIFKRCMPQFQVVPHRGGVCLSGGFRCVIAGSKPFAQTNLGAQL